MRLLLITIALITTFLCFAQQKIQFDAELSTPYDAVYNHLYHLQPDNYNPAIAARSMFNAFSMEEREDAAIKLKQYLDAKGLYVDLETIPEEANYRDTARDGYTYQLFAGIPDIYLVKKDKQWMYSRFTTDNIERLHQELYPLGSDLLLKIFPRSSSIVFLGLQLWQWLGMLSLLIVAFILYLILKPIIRLTIRKGVQKRIGISSEAALMIFNVARSASFLLILKFIQFSLPLLLLPIDVSRYIVLIINIFFTVFIVVFGFRLVDILIAYFNVVAQRTENSLDDQLIPVVNKLIKSVLVISGVFYILKLLDVNITALIAGISISGLALALAAQDTVKNMIGSVMIFFDKPFQIGDWISFEGKDGIVEEVGMRSTRIRSFENSIIYVPNGKLADAIVNNMGLRKFRRFKTELGVTYDTPPELIDAFVKGIRELISNHPYTLNENNFVYLNSFGSSSLNILIYTFFNVAEWRNELEGRHELMQAIISLADTLGVRFAFPTQTLFIEEIPGQVSLSPNYQKDPAKALKKVDEFVENFKSTYAKDQ